MHKALLAIATLAFLSGCQTTSGEKEEEKITMSFGQFDFASSGLQKKCERDNFSVEHVVSRNNLSFSNSNGYGYQSVKGPILVNDIESNFTYKTFNKKYKRDFTAPLTKYKNHNLDFFNQVKQLELFRSNIFTGKPMLDKKAVRNAGGTYQACSLLYWADVANKENAKLDSFVDEKQRNYSVRYQKDLAKWKANEEKNKHQKALAAEKEAKEKALRTAENKRRAQERAIAQAKAKQKRQEAIQVEKARWASLSPDQKLKEKEGVWVKSLAKHVYPVISFYEWVQACKYARVDTNTRHVVRRASDKMPQNFALKAMGALGPTEYQRYSKRVKQQAEDITRYGTEACEGQLYIQALEADRALSSYNHLMANKPTLKDFQ
ncbi:hypothetical protein [Photobacterium sanguinicancri]|uniref:hypothetical protein n=1 Tax=Photobacterium sanguinicancri TaxID=875932 RepID=UPI0026E15365|nr:hypothetical protein [Photobacterium sanguinicancri]MDO6496927.1 hypothetical protein [Photobacterium sanguinicancri]